MYTTQSVGGRVNTCMINCCSPEAEPIVDTDTAGEEEKGGKGSGGVGGSALERGVGEGRGVASWWRLLTRDRKRLFILGRGANWGGRLSGEERPGCSILLLRDPDSCAGGSGPTYAARSIAYHHRLHSSWHPVCPDKQA
jgi:hypothetical protein